MDTALDDIQIVRKLTLEAFDMVFDGKLAEAARVFTLVSKIRPDNRPAELGLALVRFVLADLQGGQDHTGPPAECDPFMECFRAMKLIQLGRLPEARQSLAKAQESSDEPSVRLANCITNHELNEGNPHATD